MANRFVYAGLAVLAVRATARADEVNVEVRTNEKASVQQLDERLWQTLCIAPCTARVPGDAALRVVGNGFPSEPLKLQAHDTIIDVHIPPSSNTSTGLALELIGVTFTVSGIVALLVGVVIDAQPVTTASRPDYGVADALFVGGLLAPLVGFASIGAGVSMRADVRPKLSVSARGAALLLSF